MAKTWPFKDPDEVLDYSIDWSEGDDGGPGRLPEDDAIATSTWVVPSGIVKDSDDFDVETGITTIWLSGGTVGTKYAILNRITTTQGRTMDQTVNIKIKSK